MTTIQKQALVQSLESMDSRETDQLIAFVRGLLYNPKNDMDYLRKRTRGMKEIKAAIASQSF